MLGQSLQFSMYWDPDHLKVKRSKVLYLCEGCRVCGGVEFHASN